MAVVTLTKRKLYIEDLQLTTNPAGETESATVLGAGVQTLNKCDFLRMTSLTVAANDAAAAAAGVNVGQHYWNTTENGPHTRMS